MIFLRQILNHWKWLRWEKLSLHLMRNHEEGVSGSNLSQANSHHVSESGCFLSSQWQHRLGLAWTLNKDNKKWLALNLRTKKPLQQETDLLFLLIILDIEVASDGCECHPRPDLHRLKLRGQLVVHGHRLKLVLQRQLDGLVAGERVAGDVLK